MAETDQFKHSTPALYDRYMGPLLFAPYANHVARRAALLQSARILETAAGSGIVTEAIHGSVPEAEIVATDINPAMLEFAAGRVRSDRVTFRVADAQNLPFADGSFDLVICQFGVMFFPDRVRANQEARRVLGSGGNYLLLSFDRLERNVVPKAAGDAVAALFPDGPPRYLERGPFCYSDPDLIKRDLLAAGFTHIELETVVLSSHVTARDVAQGIILGSPFRAEIERRGPSALDRALHAVTQALAPWDGKKAPMSAHVATARK
jgi:ubiquinone/menaquinone biosynthesis C-methylase UbiE